jgi:hypothetical protein
MSQTTDFDRVVSTWLHADGPIDIRPGAVDRALRLARASGQRRGLRLALTGPTPWPAYGRRIGFGMLPPSVRIALVLVLALVVASGVAVVGSQLFRIAVPLRPAAPHSFVITDVSFPCEAPTGGVTTFTGATMVDFESGVTRRLLECGNELLLSPDGIRAAAVGSDGLVLIDLGDGSRRAIPGATGTDPEPVAWSPRGTYLHWVGDNTAGRPTTAFIGPLDDPRRSRLPGPDEGGYFNGAMWSADETRVLVQSPSGWSIGNGDGSGLRAVPELGAGLLAISPDGTRLAVALPSPNDAGAALAVDAAVGDGLVAPRSVTHFPDGTQAIAAAWSPDGSTLAVVSTSRAEPTTPAAPTSNDLWLIAPDGTQRHLALPLAADPGRASGSVRWAADGEHLAIGWHTVVRNAQQQEAHHYSFVIVATVDGAFAPGDGWTQVPVEEVFFSTDGSRAVYRAGGSFEVLDLDGSGSRSPTIAQLAPIDWGGQLVWTP